MATQVKPKPKGLYDEDFYAWSRQQAALLRDGRFAELDLGHLIEEVDDLGGALKRSVRSRIGTIIEHLLKLEHSPAQDPRGGWYDTVITQRRASPTSSRRASGARSSPNSRGSTIGRAPTPLRRCASMANPAPPMRSPPTAPTASSRSPATGGREEGSSTLVEYPLVGRPMKLFTTVESVDDPGDNISHH
jgi:hypothetical protein